MDPIKKSSFTYEDTLRLRSIETAPYPNFILRPTTKIEWAIMQAHTIAVTSPEDAWHSNKYPMFFDSTRHGSGAVLFDKFPLLLACAGSRKEKRLEYCQECLRIYSATDNITREFDIKSGRGKCPNCGILLMPLFPDAIVQALKRTNQYNIRIDKTDLFTTELPNLYLVPLLIKLRIRSIYYTYPCSSETSVLRTLKANGIKIFQLPTSVFAIPAY